RVHLLSDRRSRGRRSPVAVGDAGAVEVVGGELATHAVPGQNPDPEAAHLARDVAKHFVPVVEPDLEHRVGQGLNDLALEFDLVFLGPLGDSVSDGAAVDSRFSGRSTYQPRWRPAA